MQTMRNLVGASPAAAMGSSPFLSDSLASHSAEKGCNSFTTESPRDSPSSGGGFKRNSFVFSGIKQELGSVEVSPCVHVMYLPSQLWPC
jgi:hypothetical protein